MLEHHIIPVKVYLTVFAALLVLLVVTVVAAYLDLGLLSTLIAMSIAVAKTLLIVLYFMHVRYSSRLIWVFAAAGLLWFMILVGQTMSDYMTRSWMGPTAPALGNPYDPLGSE
jgi:cytochrome c oxidase subunit 4